MGTYKRARRFFFDRVKENESTTRRPRRLFPAYVRVPCADSALYRAALWDWRWCGTVLLIHRGWIHLSRAGVSRFELIRRG